MQNMSIALYFHNFILLIIIATVISLKAGVNALGGTYYISVSGSRRARFTTLDEQRNNGPLAFPS